MPETLKPIPGFRGKYLLSDSGRVYTIMSVRPGKPDRHRTIEQYPHVILYRTREDGQRVKVCRSVESLMGEVFGG